MHDDWQFVRHNFAETDKTLEYWARNGSRSDIHFAKVSLLGMPSFEDTSRPSSQAGSCNIVEENSLSNIAARWNGHISALDIASVVNAFVCLFFFISFFILSFIILFLPGSPFRVFDPPGNSFFHAPVLAWIAFEGCQSIGVLIFA